MELNTLVMQVVPESNAISKRSIDATFIEIASDTSAYPEGSAVRELTVKLSKEPEGGFSAQCVELPAAISQGDTIEETMENIAEAVTLVLEEMGERNNFIVVTKDSGL